jgi:hypothetical protein
VQEFLASRKAVFVIGRFSIDAAVLIAVYYALVDMHNLDHRDMCFAESDLGRYVTDQWGGFRYIFLESARAISLLGGEKMDGRLANVLNTCYFREASDPRDQV